MELPRASVSEGNGEVWCSVEETNRVRAELGLGPLRVEEDGEIREHEVDDGDKVRERVAEARKRRQARCVFAARGIADSESDEEDAAHFAERMKERAEEVARRRKAAAGKEKPKPNPEPQYGANELAGMKVRHNIEQLKGNGTEQVVLTLADRDILTEKADALMDSEDELEDQTVVQSHRNEKNMASRTRDPRKAYDPLEELETGKIRPILSQYDGELADQAQPREKLHEPDEIRIGTHGNISVEKSEVTRLAAVADRLKTANRTLKTLDTEVDKAPQDFLNSTRSKRKKTEKKGRRRHRTKQPEDEDEVADVNERMAKVRAARDSMLQARRNLQLQRSLSEEETEDDDPEMRQAQTHARLVAQRKKMTQQSSVEMLASSIEVDGEQKPSLVGEGLVFDEVAEFVRQVKAEEDIKVEEKPLVSEVPKFVEADKKSEDASKRGMENQIDSAEPPSAIEPSGAIVGTMSSALNHFRVRGDLRLKEELAGRANDQRTGDLVDARSEGHDIKLDYVDDSGRNLTPQEAFRQQSYYFHGQKPSKNKLEKRLKKDVHSRSLRQRNMGVETPLNTVAALKSETKRTQAPYVVLSGTGALAWSGDQNSSASKNEDMLRKPRKRPRGED